MAIEPGTTKYTVVPARTSYGLTYVVLRNDSMVSLHDWVEVAWNEARDKAKEQAIHEGKTATLVEADNYAYWLVS